MSQNKHAFVAIIFIIATLVGCAQLSDPPPLSTQWLAHQASVSKIQNFTVKGKVAFIRPKERVSARFIWTQKGNDISLRVINFLGSTLFKLETTDENAVLVDNQGQTHTGLDATRLLERLTGISLPVDEMMRWIKGLPSPKNTYILGKDNRLASLSQHNPLRAQPGWQVKYLAYDAKKRHLLPSKINMRLGHQTVNLVISEWVYNR